MDDLNSIFSDWWIAALAGVVLAAFVWNAMNRVIWDIAWDASGNKATRIPEQCWSYDADDIKVFARLADRVWIGRQTALQFYVDNILRRSDIFFAVALASITAFVCYEVAVSPMPYEWLNWMALPLGAMAVLYGVTDVAEDLKLASILGHPQQIDRADAAATNMLTRVKMASLTLSVIGVAIFLIVALAEKLAEKLKKKATVVRT